MDDEVETHLSGAEDHLSPNQPKIYVEAKEVGVMLVQKSCGKVYEKEILKKINVTFHPGQLSALIGNSGSGKTTLLDTLALRLPPDLKLKGNITYNGSNNKSIVRKYSSYVSQHDNLLPFLTVRETLTFAARLQFLKSSLTHSQMLDRVEFLIKELGLTPCASIIIGNDIVRGCSGGEIRRVSIALALLSQPSLIFLDEPTSGLDAFTSYNLIKTLKNLKRFGKNIIMSIHQPRSDIYTLIDSITLMAKGEVLYSGTKIQMEEFFTRIGYPCPNLTNPAEFFLESVSVDYRTEDSLKESKERIQKISEEWKNSPQEFIDLAMQKNLILEKAEEFAIEIEVHKSIFYILFNQTLILSLRSFKNIYRDKSGLIGSFLGSSFLALAFGLIFLQSDDTLEGIYARIASFYMSFSLFAYITVTYMTYRLSEEVKVFYREAKDSLYGPLSFLMSQLVSLFPFILINSLIFSVLTYFMIGYRSPVDYFGGYLGIQILIQANSMMIAWACVSLSKSYEDAINLGNLLFAFLSYTAGFLIKIDDIPIYINWITAISPFTYSFRFFVSQEFTDRDFPCPLPPDDPICDAYRGNSILSLWNIAERDFVNPPIVLSASFLFFFLLTLVGLLYFRPKKGVSKVRDKKKKKDKKRSATIRRSFSSYQFAQQNVYITVSVSSLNLYVSNINTKEKIHVLKDIAAEFKPGTLTIILGGSGCGKTSLLNTICRRTPTGLFNKSIVTGNILYNNVEPSNRILKSNTSYVVQSDGHLNAYLTVRETITYAAHVRLPKDIKRIDKIRRAIEIINSLGLSECQNTLVGNDLVKGVSGGERRRVSIAIQLINDPSVILLDEPTTGLDSFTASFLLKMLSDLAKSGRTVIATIHQPPSHALEIVDNVLLMGKGGRVVYFGKPQSMLKFFKSKGLECPPRTNPADFVIDKTSLDTRSDVKHTESSKRLEVLIGKYKEEIAMETLQENSDEIQRSPNQEGTNTPTDPTETQSQEVRSSTQSDLPTTDPPLSKPSKVTRISSLPSLPRPSSDPQFSDTETLDSTDTPFVIAYIYTLARFWKAFTRKPDVWLVGAIQCLATGLFLALFFGRLDDSGGTETSRIGILYQYISVFFAGMSSSLSIYPQEQKLFLRDYADGAYSWLPFCLAYLTFESIFEILGSFIYVILVYFIINLKVTAAIFFISSFCAFCAMNVGQSIGITFLTFSEPGFSVSITSLCISLFAIMSGLFNSQMNKVFEIINYASPMRYIVRIAAINEFTDFTFDCSEKECQFDTGEQLLEFLTFDEEDLNTLIWNLAVLTILIRLVSWICLAARLFVKGRY